MIYFSEVSKNTSLRESENFQSNNQEMTMPLCLQTTVCSSRHCEARSNLAHCAFNIPPRREPRHGTNRVLRTRWGDCFVVPPRNDGSTKSVHNRNQQTLNWPKAEP